jgi:hypothetical protein
MAGVLDALGVKWIAADNSREPAQYRIGGATTVPRYPSNVYYNVETQAEQLDEYNYIYLPPPAGKCVNSATNTCRTTPATWAEYVDSEATIMFRHLMGNDPRPHFAHQSNLAGDGVLYTVVDEVLRRYNLYFNPALVQLTQTQIAGSLAREAAWAQNLAAGRATAYLQDGQVHVTTTAAIEVPITGTPQGDLYGGERSGWFTVNPGTPLVQQAPPAAQPVARPAPPASPASGASRSPSSASKPNATGTKPGTAPSSGARGPAARPQAAAARLRLTRLRMTPRRFAVSHNRRTVRRRRALAPDGTTITWVLNRPATVRLSIRRVVRKGRTASVQTFDRRAIRGENAVRLSGRIGRRVLRPGRYVLRISARNGASDRTRTRTIAFTVVRG